VWYEVCNQCNEEINDLIAKPKVSLEENKESTNDENKIADKSTAAAVRQVLLGQYDGHNVFIKKGKYGSYLSWGAHTRQLKETGNRPIENISFEEIQPYLEEGGGTVREINSNLSIRRAPRGDYLFYKTSRMKKPQFHDIHSFAAETNENYKTCSLNVLKEWIRETYNLF
jgi:hypothetical protein